MRFSTYAIALWTFVSSAVLAAPQVVETFPQNGARAVDPTLKEIRVVFDQPMSQRGWSWCGGGDHYPELAGQPAFVDEYTAVLPVSLKEEHTYFIGINCPSARNFRGADGTSAISFPLHFTTTSTTDTLVVADFTNNRACNDFYDAFSKHYSYYTTFGIEWEKLWPDARPWLLRSPNPDVFALRLRLFLGEAKDPHLRVVTPDGTRHSTYRRNAEFNGNVEAIRRAFPGLEEHNRLVWSARKERVGYLAIHSWSNENDEMGAAQRAIADMQHSTDVLILDVRGNDGGDELTAKAVAARFVEETSVYCLNRYRDPKAADGWGEMFSRSIRPAPEDQRYPGWTIVLQGPICLSSNESFILMMAQGPRVLLVGDTSGGSSANPKRYPLANGLQVSLPSWEEYLPDGTLMERRGVHPHMKVTGDFTNNDPVLERALELAADPTLMLQLRNESPTR